MDGSDLTDRLRDFGSQPVPDDVSAHHTHRITAVAPAATGARFGRLAVAAAAVVGFAFGSTGLAMAGALPEPAQNAAHDVLSTVNINVPDGTRGQCISDAARNKDDPDAKQDAKEACPKGGPPDGVDRGRSGEAPGRSGTAPGLEKHADDPCRGKPPWAGNNDLTPEERAAEKAGRAGACRNGAEKQAEAQNGPENEPDTVPGAGAENKPDTVPGDAPEVESDEEPEEGEPAG